MNAKFILGLLALALLPNTVAAEPNPCVWIDDRHDPEHHAEAGVEADRWGRFRVWAGYQAIGIEVEQHCALPIVGHA